MLYSLLFFFLMIRRPPRSTLDRSSAASDVYKRQLDQVAVMVPNDELAVAQAGPRQRRAQVVAHEVAPVSYTHLRAHETVLDLVCRLLLEKQNTTTVKDVIIIYMHQ